MNTNGAKLEQAKAQLAVTRNQAGYASLVAPEDGVITAVTAEAGQVVAAGAGVMRHRARGRARSRDRRARERGSTSSQRATQIGVVLCAESGKLYPRAGARNRADGRSGDAHVRRARVASPTRRRRCNGA